MRHWWLLSLWLPLAALDLSIQSGKEGGDPFSILHLRNTELFRCESTKDDFDVIKQIVCTFEHTPKHSFEPIHNLHFTISPAKTNNAYTITITPVTKLKLIPLPFDLTKRSETFQSEINQTNHWIVVGYRRTPPMLSSENGGENAINFPVKIHNHTNPYVGGLDLKGNPIKISRVQDVTDYMQLKKAYGEKDFAKVLGLAKNTLKKYPKTIFKNELILYQIRALHEQEQYDTLLEVSKQFLRDYSGDSNIAEVLAYTANAYSKIGQPTDADYFFDRLFDEHAHSPFAAQGMIYKAQQLEGVGNTSKAAKYYAQALSSSKEIGIASKAAFRLAQIELTSGNVEKAKGYVEKIGNANPEYFNEVKEDAVKLANAFREQHEPRTAAMITENILKVNPLDSLDHERLLKDLGMQLALANRREEALKRFNEYLKMYKFGEFVEDVRRAKDGLFFDENENNATAAIKKYDDLIERYGNDPVGLKALYKKAQLLFKEKQYKEILEIETDLYHLDSGMYPEANSLIPKSAVELSKEYLKVGKCTEALSMQKMYKIKLLPQWDGLNFECALKTAQYPMAKTIAQSHLKSKSMSERQLWLYRIVKTQFALGEYKNAIKGGEELASLLNSEKNPPLNDIYRTLFDAMQRSGNGDGMIRHIKNIETLFKNDFKDIERYTQMVALGTARQDEALTQTYARKVMALQERTKTYTQTPYIEFTLAQSYQKIGRDVDAFETLKSLNTRKIDKEKRARQHYLMGSLAQKMGRKAEARASYNASIKADSASAWGKLAKDALALL